MSLNWDNFTRGRLKSIDLLRGVAALAVVFQHSTTAGPYAEINSTWFQTLCSVLNMGHLGVPLFFVISGYCIHSAVATQIKRDGKSSFSFVSFWKRRIYRLYPTYLVVLIFSMSLIVVAYFLGLSFALVERYPEPKLTYMAYDFFAHTLMLHGFFPLFDKGAGNPPLWTIAREEYLYMLYLGIVFFRHRLNIWAIVISTALLGIGFYGLTEFYVGSKSMYWGILSSSAIVLWIQWALGTISVESNLGLTKIPSFLKNGLALIPLGILSHYSVSSFPILTPMLWGLCFFVLVNWFTRIELSGNWPMHKGIHQFEKLGVMSYSLYLIHYPVIGILKIPLRPLLNTTNPLLYLLAITILVCCSIGAALLLFAVVESRFVRSRSN